MQPIELTLVELPCGECKLVRSFSGTPPTCPMCGWVSTPARQRFINFKEQAFGWFLAVAFLFLLSLPLAFSWYWFFPASWYAVMNGTDSDHVVVQPEPHDCDFSKAPLGDKECHYEKKIETQTDSKTGKVSVSVYWNRVDGN
jgi:hypothetical protein